MEKVLLIRRKKQYYENGILGWSIHHFYKELIQPWNFFFNLKYLDFRKKLAAIAQETFDQNKFDQIIPYEDFERVRKLSPGTLLLPIDEDDFLAPNMILELEKEFDGRDLYWDVFRVKSKGRVSYIKGTARWLVASCGYCVQLPTRSSQITYHWCFKKENMKYINKLYSLKLNAISSISLIRSNHNPTFEYHIKEIVSWLNSEYKIPEEFRVSFDKYRDLLRELLESCRFPYGDIV